MRSRYCRDTDPDLGLRDLKCLGLRQSVFAVENTRLDKKGTLSLAQFLFQHDYETLESSRTTRRSIDRSY